MEYRKLPHGDEQISIIGLGNSSLGVSGGAEGVGISVMKAFSGGQLLDAQTSPFGKALTEYQCMQYALDRPGVLTVLPGVRNREDLKRILGMWLFFRLNNHTSILNGVMRSPSNVHDNRWLTY